MKIIDCNQRDDAWFAARLGRATASCFDQIITPKTMKASASAPAYMRKLLLEWIFGQSEDEGGNQWMQRGTNYESDARNWFAFTHDCDVQEVGFCLSDCGRYGCSPDGLLVGVDEGLEIKTPSAEKHLDYLLNGIPATEYICQIQGGMLVTGRNAWWLVSYNPYLPPVAVRFERSPEFIDRLRTLLEQFCDELDDAKSRLRELGVKVASDFAAQTSPGVPVTAANAAQTISGGSAH